MTPFQHQREAWKIGAPVQIPFFRIDPGNVIPEAKRRCQNAEPARIVALPINSLQRHAQDIGGPGTRRRIQHLLGDRIAILNSALREPARCFLGEHPRRQFCIRRYPGVAAFGTPPYRESSAIIWESRWRYAFHDHGRPSVGSMAELSTVLPASR